MVFRRLHRLEKRISASDCRHLSISSECTWKLMRLYTGFDLVGHEDTLQPLIYYIKPLLWFRERQREEGVDIPFIFHAGETLGDGTEADVNLYDAILLGTKRIGHGCVA